MRARRLRAREQLGVFMNGVEVGHLERAPSGAVSFAYAPGWLDRVPLMAISRQLPVREAPYVGTVVSSYLEGLLPDDPRALERLPAHAKAKGTQPFDLLAAIGRDCVGALQFYPEGEEPGLPHAAKGTPLSAREIGALLESLSLNPLGLREDSAFRISVAGAQSKTALLKLDGRWCVPNGSTATTHIFKPQIGPLPDGPDLSLSVENEWLCLELLRAFGLSAARAEISEFDGVRALVVERFDRLWKGRQLIRVAQEDLCQALGVGPKTKYESDGGPGIRAIMRLLDESDRRDADRRAFMKSQILFWLIAAIDAHAKNFSVRIRPGGFSLTPLYDVMSAAPLVNKRTLPEQKVKLAMAIGDNRRYQVREISARHFRQTAEAVGFREIDSLLEEVAAELPAAIDQVIEALPKRFPVKVSQPIFAALRERAAGLGRRK